MLESSSTEARRRLIRDFKKIQENSEQGFHAQPLGENLFEWEALLFGPENTAWEGGNFRLNLKFTEQYPQVAPVVKFVSPIFHPNVYSDGRVCLDILDNNWSPVYDVSTILISLQSLLADPNPKSPANAEAARLFDTDKAAYAAKVMEFVERTWEEK